MRKRIPKRTVRIFANIISDHDTEFASKLFARQYISLSIPIVGINVVCNYWTKI